MSFTRGPWLVETESGVRIYAPDPYGHGRMHIAEVRGWGHLIGTGSCGFDNGKAAAIQDANARVLGAGPEMFDLLNDPATNTAEWADRRLALLLRVAGDLTKPVTP